MSDGLWHVPVKLTHEQLDVHEGTLDLAGAEVVEVSLGCPKSGAAVCTLVRLPDGREIHIGGTVTPNDAGVTVGP